MQDTNLVIAVFRKAVALEVQVSNPEMVKALQKAPRHRRATTTALKGCGLVPLSPPINLLLTPREA